MAKAYHHAIIQKIREITPLGIRQFFGPTIARVHYFYKTKIKKNQKRFNILPKDETLDLIIKDGLSVVRFGDGEMSLMAGVDLAFQKNDSNLAKKLEDILRLNLEGLLICVPGILKNLDGLKGSGRRFCLHHLFRYGHIWEKLLSDTRIYGDSGITRPFLACSDKTNCEQFFKKIFSIWAGKDVVLIEGDKSRLGVGNDMFADTKCLQRILCPSENAFAKYEQIKNEAMKIGKDKLVLLALGPAAKVLAYDLFLAGYRVVDIGHIDMEYEMFLKKADRLEPVRYKYFNEIGERNPEDCREPKYLSEIIARV